MRPLSRLTAIGTQGRFRGIPHPKFAGVFLRHLVTGHETGGRMSLHHVRIDPGCSIGNHTHAGQVEIHDVISGEGTCTLAGKEIRYVPGIMGIMPADNSPG